MGGKGGGGGNYYQQPADTSGYGTPEEAKATLAAQSPLDMSKYQQTIDVQKAANLATAPDVSNTQGGSGTGDGTTQDFGSQLASSVLTPPNYWSNRGDLAPSSLKKSSIQTTQT